VITSAEIRMERARLKMSQRELSRVSGVGLTTIVALEDDNRGPEKSTMTTLKKVMDALGLNDRKEN